MFETTQQKDIILMCLDASVGIRQSLKTLLALEQSGPAQQQDIARDIAFRLGFIEGALKGLFDKEALP